MDWLLGLRAPELTAVFRAFSFLGDVTFFLLFIPLGYWLWRPGLFYRLGVLLLVSTLINVTLKAIFQVPRPDVLQLVAASGWSFPSGHAQTAATIWPWLVLELGGSRRWMWAAATALIAGVSMSRVYLGVHYPRDVFVGIAVGLLIAAAAWWLYRRTPRWWRSLGTHLQVGAGVSATAIWIMALGSSANHTVALAGGALLGFWAGGLYQRHTVGFTVPSGWPRALAAAVLGLTVTFSLRFGLKAGFADLGMAAGSADVVRYLVTTLWITWGAPWVFAVLGIAGLHQGDRCPDQE